MHLNAFVYLVSVSSSRLNVILLVASLTTVFKQKWNWWELKETFGVLKIESVEHIPIWVFFQIVSVVVIVCLSLAYAAPLDDSKDAQILRYENENTGFNGYKFA